MITLDGVMQATSGSKEYASGKRLFGEGTQPERFKQVEAVVLSSGILFATYDPSTPLKAGSL